MDLRVRDHLPIPRTRFPGAAAALALSLLCGCGNSAAPKPSAPPTPDPVPVSLVEVARFDAPRSVEITGSLYGTEEATIAAEVPGRVESIAFDVGDVVAQGAVLAQLERTQYSLALDQKRAALLESLAELGLRELPSGDFDAGSVPTVAKALREAENADARFGRAEQLWNQQPPLISEQDYSDLRTARDVARSDHDVALLRAKATLATARARDVEIALAQDRLDDTTVRAPKLAAGQEGVTYRVAARQVSVGEYVAAGAPTFRLVASDPIKFRGRAPERFVSAIALGQEATLKLEGLATPARGTVTRVSPQIEATNRTFEVEITVPNAEGTLRAGAFAVATIVVGTDAAVPFVPRDIVVTFAGVSKIFSVSDGKAKEHQVSLGRRRDVDGEAYVEVIGAPDSISEVVSEGARRLATGTPVTRGSSGTPPPRTP
jgi:RND family efflux transporter MFP subunit